MYGLLSLGKSICNVFCVFVIITFFYSLLVGVAVKEYDFFDFLKPKQNKALRCNTIIVGLLQNMKRGLPQSGPINLDINFSLFFYQ